MCVRAIDVWTSCVWYKASCNRCRLSARWRSHRSNVSERGNDGAKLRERQYPDSKEADLLSYTIAVEHTAQYKPLDICEHPPPTIDIADAYVMIREYYFFFFRPSSIGRSSTKRVRLRSSWSSTKEEKDLAIKFCRGKKNFALLRVIYRKWESINLHFKPKLREWNVGRI